MRFVVVALIVFSALPLTAQEQQDERARQRFEEAALAYSEARYEAALQLFEESFEMSGRTDLLYNIGLTLERLRRDEDAIVPFEQYLETDPPEQRRQEVERRLAGARERIAARTRTEEGDAAEPSSPAPWIVAATGGAVAVAGAVLWAIGAAKVADVEDTPPGTVDWSEVSGDADRGRALSLAGISLVSVGVATGVVGLSWGIARPGSGDDARAVLEWRGRF